MKNNIAFTMEIPANLSPVLADKDKLIIVLNNLLSNALKFTYNGGSVLGLSISSGIISAHGSEICVESEPQKGSIFYFRLEKFENK